jgi:acetyltransferase-like isoleucine patch superfamily enzyme
MGKLKKLGTNFFKQPFPFLFYLFDLFNDTIWLRIFGYLWQTECRLRGGKIFKSKIYGRPVFKFHPLSNVIIGKSASLISKQRRCSSANLYGPCRIQTLSATSAVLIGENVGLNGTSIVSRSAVITIGKKTMIAPNCVIMDSPFHRILPVDQRLNYNENDLDKNVVIGEQCWIGINCIILAGSVIGDNSVVGAGSIVNGIIPPNCLAIGRPAKPVKYFK